MHDQPFTESADETHANGTGARLMVSQLLTLYLTPVVYLYLYLDRFQEFFRRKRQEPAPQMPLGEKPAALVRG